MQRASLLIVLMLISVQTAVADDEVSPKVTKVLQEIDRQQKSWINYYEDRIRFLSKTRGINDRKVLATRRRLVKESKAKLDDVKDFKFTLELRDGLKVGDVGKPASARVRQILNAEEMLAEFKINDYRGMEDSSDHPKVQEYTVWVKGFSTKGFIDDDLVEFPKYIEISNTTTYTTVTGATKTVYVAESFDDSELVKVLRGR